MDDQLLMNVVDTLTDLPYNFGNILLIHALLPAQSLQKLSTRAELDQQVELSLILEVTIELCYVPVLEVELNAEFPSNLLYVLLFPDLLLLHDLEPADPSRQLMAY